MEFHFKGVTVEFGFSCLGEVFSRPSMAWMEIEVPKSKKMIQIQVSATLKDGIIPLAVFNSKAKKLQGKRFLAVPVQWKNFVPHTRQQGVDNIDIILLRDDGQFLDIQVGIVTRQSRFFITAQQIYKGRVVRTREKGLKFGEVTYTCVPTDPIHAYPGSAYKAIWVGMAEELIRVAKEEEASRQRSRVKKEIAQWSPPIEVGEANGWRSGVVLYFNLISGTGKIRDGKNEDYFVHFKTLPEDGMTALEPMTRVRFKTRATDKKQIASVRH